jgi:hypothetical protein
MSWLLSWLLVVVDGRTDGESHLRLAAEGGRVRLHDGDVLPEDSDIDIANDEISAQIGNQEISFHLKPGQRLTIQDVGGSEELRLDDGSGTTDIEILPADSGAIRATVGSHGKVSDQGPAPDDSDEAEPEADSEVKATGPDPEEDAPAEEEAAPPEDNPRAWARQREAHLGRKAKTSLRRFLDGFRVCGECRHGGEAGMERLGMTLDGGYVMCREASQGVHTGYSLGISDEDAWSNQFAEVHGVTTIYQYDCTIDHPPMCGNPCHAKWHKICIDDGSHPDDPNFRTLKSLVDETARSGDHSLSLKMDIEGSEWGVLANADQRALLRFRQIIVEFHWIQETWQKQPEVAERAMEVLQRNFVLVHSHGNHWNAEANFTIAHRKYEVPEVIETTWVRKDLARKIPCMNARYDFKLDHRNEYPENRHFKSARKGMPVHLPDTKPQSLAEEQGPIWDNSMLFDTEQPHHQGDGGEDYNALIQGRRHSRDH